MTLSTDPNKLEYRWVSKIDEIKKKDWEDCFAGCNILQSYDFAKAVEHSRLEQIDHCYLVAYTQEKVAAIIPCFLYRVSITVVSGPFMQKIVNSLRKINKNLLYFNTFIAGSPTAICTHLLGIPGLGQDRFAGEILKKCDEQVKIKAKELKCKLIILKEIPHPLNQTVEEFLDSRYVFTYSLPTTYISLAVDSQNPVPYMKRLRKKYRVLMKKRQKIFTDAGLTWEICQNATPYASQFEKLYLQVLEHSAHKFEKLSADFFVKVLDYLGDDAFIMVCKRDEQIVAFELVLKEEAHLHPIYLGMDYQLKDEAEVYFNCVYRILEEGEKRKCSVVQLGQTSYEAKSSMGAVPNQLFVGLYHSNKFLNWCIGKLAHVLFPTTTYPERKVFKESYPNLEILEEHGVPFDITEGRR